jgi:hypothetical protein
MMGPIASVLTLKCLRDSTAERTLTSIGFTELASMTVEFCLTYCDDQNQIPARLPNDYPTTGLRRTVTGSALAMCCRTRTEGADIKLGRMLHAAVKNNSALSFAENLENSKREEVGR